MISRETKTSWILSPPVYPDWFSTVYRTSGPRQKWFHPPDGRSVKDRQHFEKKQKHQKQLDGGLVLDSQTTFKQRYRTSVIITCKLISVKEWQTVWTTQWILYYLKLTTLWCSKHQNPFWLICPCAWWQSRFRELICAWSRFFIFWIKNIHSYGNVATNRVPPSRAFWLIFRHNYLSNQSSHTFIYHLTGLFNHYGFWKSTSNPSSDQLSWNRKIHDKSGHSVPKTVSTTPIQLWRD